MAGNSEARDFTRLDIHPSGRGERTPWLPRNNVGLPPGSAVFRFTFTAIRMRSRRGHALGWTRSSVRRSILTAVQLKKKLKLARSLYYERLAKKSVDARRKRRNDPREKRP